MLRVKVEDGNDLLMADQTLDELNTFYQRLQAHAAETGEECGRSTSASSEAARRQRGFV